MKIIATIFSLLASFHTYAGWLDSFKEPATLILNQNDCYIGSARGEIVDGRFIVSGVSVITVLKKIDKNRVVYESQHPENQRKFILNIFIKDGFVQGAVGSGRTIIWCKLN